MSWFISIIVAVLTGLVALFFTGLISNACVSWYHISSREGASGYFVIFNSLAGGIVGIVIGLITARIIAANFGSGFGKELGAAVGVVLVIAGVSAALCRMLADVPPRIDGRYLTLEVEFRFPEPSNAGRPPTAEGEWNFQLGSVAGHTRRAHLDGSVKTELARFDAGRWIVPAEVALFTERGRRTIGLQRDGHDVGGFLVPLPSRPGKNFENWSDWLPRQQADGSSWPSDKMSYRYRVQKVPLPPPPKSAEEWQAEEMAAKDAEFASIPAGSPIEAWFPYIAYDQPQTKRALQLIAQRPDMVNELGRLVTGDDPKKAHAALLCISQLSEPPRELIPAVQAAGREIAERITKFNNTPKEEDPSFEAAVDPATRFYGWIPAAKTLRQKCGADLTPELKIILELSRVRPESHCMRSDICRVASFYLHQWAGIAPLPTDPKPL